MCVCVCCVSRLKRTAAGHPGGIKVTRFCQSSEVLNLLCPTFSQTLIVRLINLIFAVTFPFFCALPLCFETVHFFSRYLFSALFFLQASLKTFFQLPLHVPIVHFKSYSTSRFVVHVYKYIYIFFYYSRI